MEIPDVNHDLDHGVPFTAEAWVMPGGGDPNDPAGTSFASTEWTAIIKKGGGGAYYTENGDVNNQKRYGRTVALAGKRLFLHQRRTSDTTLDPLVWPELLRK